MSHCWQRGLLALVVASMVAFAPAAASAQTGGQSLISYALSAQAPVLQVTEDGSTAQFHPQGEGELNYAEADMDTGHAHALSTVFWPGGAAGNLGSLLSILGVPGLGALNDPARAEVSTSGQTVQNLGAGPTTMAASIQPAPGTSQQASARTTTAATPALGGLASSQATLTLGDDGTLKATASSSAASLDIGGAVSIGSITASATATSTNAGAPTSTTSISAGRFLIGGQPACLDSRGVHMGTCGSHTSPQAISAANQSLKQAGMQIYFTEPRQLKIGNTIFNYAASLLFIWQIPADPSNDVVTMSFGGAAVAMQATGGANTAASGDVGGPIDAGTAASGTTGGGGVSIPANTATPTLVLPTGGATGGPVVATRRLPSSRGRNGNPQLALTPVSVARSHGIGTGWIALLILAAVVGAVALPRLPALLTAAAQPVCPDEPRSGNR